MLLNKFSYIGAGIGLILGALLTYVMPLSKTGLTALVDVKNNTEIAILAKEPIFLQKAQKHACAEGLKAHLDPRKNRNFNIYIVNAALNKNYAKITIYGDSEKQLACYLEGIIAQYNITLEEDIAYRKQQLTNLEELMVQSKGLFDGKYISEFDYYFNMHVDLSSMMALKSIKPYGVSFSEHVPLKTRFIIIMFAAFIGFVFGFAWSLFKKTLIKS